MAEVSVWNQRWGQKTHDDGHSRPFGGGTSRDVVAETLARREGWVEIRPRHWTAAGAVVKALKEAGWPLGQRDRKDTTDA